MRLSGQRLLISEVISSVEMEEIARLWVLRKAIWSENIRIEYSFVGAVMGDTQIAILRLVQKTKDFEN